MFYFDNNDVSDNKQKMFLDNSDDSNVIFKIQKTVFVFE